MEAFLIEGGNPLRGTIVPQGAKNEALEVICATLLTDDLTILAATSSCRNVRLSVALCL